MKKISAIIFAVVLVVLSLSACAFEDREYSLSTTATIHPLEETANYPMKTDWQTTSTTTKNTTARQASKTTKWRTSTTTLKVTTATTTNTTVEQTTEASTTETTARTTTTTVPKTTRTATKMELETLYSIAYNKVMEAYYQYQIEQTGYIAKLETEIANKEATANAMYVNCQEEMAKYNTESAKIAIYNTYQKNVAPLREEINELNRELNQAKEDYAISEGQLQGIIQEEYLAAVEEFQQKTLS